MPPRPGVQRAQAAGDSVKRRPNIAPETGVPHALGSGQEEEEQQQMQQQQNRRVAGFVLACIHLSTAPLVTVLKSLL